MSEELSDQELGHRLSAGRGYRRESVASFARRIDVERHDLSDWERGDFGSKDRYRTKARKREEAVKLVRAASGLPTEFFSIDLSKLPEMVAAWRQVRDEVATPEEMIAAQEQDAVETLPPDPSESQTGAQEP